MSDEYIIPARSGKRIDVKQGQLITVIDMDGGQVVDFFAEVTGCPGEFLSPGVTIDCNESLKLKIGDTIYIKEDVLYSDEQLIMQVAKGDIDFAVCNQQEAERMAKQYPEIDIQTDISFTQLQSWAVRKDSPLLLDSLNRWLNTLKQNGTYDKIYNKYYKNEKR